MVLSLSLSLSISERATEIPAARRPQRQSMRVHFFNDPVRGGFQGAPLTRALMARPFLPAVRLQSGSRAEAEAACESRKYRRNVKLRFSERPA